MTGTNGYKQARAAAVMTGDVIRRLTAAATGKNRLGHGRNLVHRRCLRLAAL
jgi:hypothetical protein